MKKYIYELLDDMGGKLLLGTDTEYSSRDIEAMVQAYKESEQFVVLGRGVDFYAWTQKAGLPFTRVETIRVFV